MDLTVIILTKNEELNIEDAIKSVKINNFASRVVVVDSYSTDKTVELAMAAGADVYQNKFVNYATQFNWGIDNTSISTKWTMRLDADERLTEKLVVELEKIMKEHSDDDDDVTGVTMESWLYFMGKCIKHGGHKKRKIMLFKTGIGRIEDRRMDEHTILKKGIAVSAKERFIHYDFKDLTHWVNKMNWYATREMQDYVEYAEGKNAIDLDDKTIQKIRKKKFGFYYKLPMFFRCWMLCVYFYIFKLGFLDGKEGFVYHWMYQRWYRTLVDAKILEQKITGRPFEETGDLK